MIERIESPLDLAEDELEEDDVDTEDDFGFDDEDDELMERSQRKLLRDKLNRPPRGRGDW